MVNETPSAALLSLEQLLRTHGADAALRSVKSIADGLKWVGPKNPAMTGGEFSLPAGLHLMSGPRGVGKSTTALAFALYLMLQCNLSPVYKYMMEPRATGEYQVTTHTQWIDFLDKLVSDVRSVNSGPGIGIVDSGTYTLPLTLAPEVTQALGNAAFKGGLTVRDILSTLWLSNRMMDANVALIVTVNSELYPSVDVLEGAAEGIIEVVSPGSFTYKNRSKRIDHAFNLPQSLVQLAFAIVGSKKGSDITTDPARGRSVME
jgi:hypothetical protein